MRLTVTLDGRAPEMAQEEIQKQVAYLSSDIHNVRFAANGAVLDVSEAILSARAFFWATATLSAKAFSSAAAFWPTKIFWAF